MGFFRRQETIDDSQAAAEKAAAETDAAEANAKAIMYKKVQEIQKNPE
jgi:hypothetical protein